VGTGPPFAFSVTRSHDLAPVRHPFVAGGIVPVASAQRPDAARFAYARDAKRLCWHRDRMRMRLQFKGFIQLGRRTVRLEQPQWRPCYRRSVSAKRRMAATGPRHRREQRWVDTNCREPLAAGGRRLAGLQPASAGDWILSRPWRGISTWIFYDELLCGFGLSRWGVLRRRLVDDDRSMPS
jgi:hypothetical protein